MTSETGDPDDMQPEGSQLERLIDETPFMMTCCSRDLQYRFVSRAYADMLGRHPADIEGTPIIEVMGDEGFTGIEPYVQRVLRGERVEFESDVKFAGVGTRFLRTVYTPDRDSQGQVIGWIASILDITDQRGASEARALVTSIVESSVDAIITKDLDGIVTSWNAAAQQLFGYSVAEMVGASVRRLIPSERQFEEDEILARLRQGERVEHFETVRIAKDGRRVDVSVTISPVRNASGTIVGASHIARDISAAKAAEAERLRLLEQNIAVTEALNNVGAVVASDLDRDKVVQAVTDAATAHDRCIRRVFLQRRQRERRVVHAVYDLRCSARGLLRLSDAAKHCRLRADVQGNRHHSQRRYHDRSPIRPQRAPPRDAARSSASAELPCSTREGPVRGRNWRTILWTSRGRPVH